MLASATADAEMTAAVPDPHGFGVDFDCADDLTELLELASGPKALAQAVYRRLTTPRAALLDAPDYGYDLRELLCRGMTSADLAAIPGIIRSEVTKDERIFDVTTRVSQPAADTLELSDPLHHSRGAIRPGPQRHRRDGRSLGGPVVILLLPIDQLTKPLTRKQVRESIYRLLAAMKLPVTAWQDGGVAKAIISVVSAIFAGFTEVIALAIRANFLDTAEGIWLTLLAYYVYGVQRIEATFASGEVQLVNTGGGIFEFEPGEFICRHAVSGQQYTNVAFFRLEAGQTLNVAIRALEAGSRSSATPGQITVLVTTMRGVTCSNPAPVVGRDGETDPELRERCRDSLGALSPNGPEAAYSYWAKSARRADGQPVNVNRVWVSKASSVGHVTVYVASPSGAVPGTIDDDSTDLGAVDKAIRTKVVPLGVTCTVASAVPHPLPITCEVWISKEANLNEAQIILDVGQRINSYYSSSPIGGHTLSPGTTGFIFKNAIIGQIEAVYPSIIKADVSTPAGDVELLENEVALGSVNSVTVHQA
ncbi:baseplate J/gp47 family protein [Sorangium sp. So ce1036]|uniref:baseplate J/gp47 family protein n=1 Tax=Sorangium sp. So ce1036 TaxID=3133328 RepID=UPI003F122F6C